MRNNSVTPKSNAFLRNRKSDLYSLEKKSQKFWDLKNEFLNQVET